MAVPPIRLISFRECPYVQRSVIALQAKGIVPDVTFIDLQNKPDWFLAMNPRGKVPVVVVNDRVIYESAIINEFLEELVPEPALLPTDLFDRAEARIWVDYAGTASMAHVAAIMFSATEEAESAARAALDQSLRVVDAELARRGAGPFFFGETFTLVDATWAPCFDRFRALEASWGWSWPEGTERVQAWAQALLAHPFVAPTRLDDLVEKYDVYRQRQLAGRTSS